MTIRRLSALLAPDPAVAPAPDPRWRLALALLVGILSAAYVVAYARANPDFISDFDQVWGAGRALLAHKNPYEVVGPGREFYWHWPFYYPLPAVLVTAPMALLPVIWARAVFSGLSAGLMAWAITKDGFHRWPVFISISFVTAVELSQWSPLLMAAMFVPSLGWLAVTKPNLGIVMGAYARTNRSIAIMVGGALALVVVSFLILPTWFADWIALVRAAPHFRAPITRPFGFVLLLALVRWRRPEARLLAALAIVPQTPTFYDHVFAFAAARTFREALILTVCTFGVFFTIAFNSPLSGFEDWGNLLARATVYFVYLPTLALVLRRPNEGEVPAVVAHLGRLLRAGARRVRSAIHP